MSFLKTSIGKKILMALSGIFMYLFLVGHLSGNFLLYVGREAFNAYADFLNELKFLPLIEAGLILILLVHVITAIKLNKENESAKKTKYQVRNSGGKRSWASSHMFHSGMIILIFIVIHIITLKYGNWNNLPYSNTTLYDLVVNEFSSPYYSGFYVLAMIFLSFHLHHAFKSALVTLGVSNSNIYEPLRIVSAALSILFGVGFSSFPIYFYLQSF